MPVLDLQAIEAEFRAKSVDPRPGGTAYTFGIGRKLDARQEGKTTAELVSVEVEKPFNITERIAPSTELVGVQYVVGAYRVPRSLVYFGRADPHWAFGC